MVDIHPLPLEPPVCPCPLGDEEEGVSLVLADFLQDAVEEGPGWVDVCFNAMPAVGKRVASKGVGVVGVRGEVIGNLMVLRGDEDISGRRCGSRCRLCGDRCGRA